MLVVRPAIYGLFGWSEGGAHICSEESHGEKTENDPCPYKEHGSETQGEMMADPDTTEGPTTMVDPEQIRESILSELPKYGYEPESEDGNQADSQTAPAEGNPTENDSQESDPEAPAGEEPASDDAKSGDQNAEGENTESNQEESVNIEDDLLGVEAEPEKDPVWKTRYEDACSHITQLESTAREQIEFLKSRGLEMIRTKNGFALAPTPEFKDNPDLGEIKPESIFVGAAIGTWTESL